ncbi:PVC-type heme-binding CxxCH protein [Novipirellula sp. SH528]|uniref:PVC-type heme-binding CxxCH protein n=1 Tax=Novipirellula sp. SH528 TaxID=3454466 RepID=UPI003FA12A21
MKFLFLSIIVAFVFSNPASAQTSSLIRVLIVDGRNNHAWQGTSTALRSMLLQTGAFSVDVTTAPNSYSARRPQRPAKDASEQEVADYDASLKVWQTAERNYETSLDRQWEQWRPNFSDFDVVIDNYNGPDWPVEVKADLVQFVQGGGGLIVLHAANNCFANWDEFNRMIGLGWRKHDQGIRVTIDDATGKPIIQPAGEGPESGHGSKHAFAVRTRAADHPIMRGIPLDWMHGTDELYHAMRGPAVGVQVLASAFSAKEQGGTDQHEPVIWTTDFGKGRVVTNSLGHYWPTGGLGDRTRHSLHCVGFQTMMARSCQWVAGYEVTLDVPPEFPNAEATSIVSPDDMHWTVDGETLSLAPQAIADASERAAMKKERNPYAMLTTEESLATLKLPDGYRAEVILAEPEIREPVLAVWDGNGRMYVAEMRSYMQDELGTGTKNLRNGRISRHEDTNGDGTLDRHTVFVDGLNLPRMILPLDDRIAVVETDSTDIHSYRDTDNDGIADEKLLLFKGTAKIDASRSVEHQDSGLFWSIDNWIYLSRGRERYKINPPVNTPDLAMKVKDEAAVRVVKNHVQVAPIEFDWNQWGMDQDDTGRLFFSANSEPLKSFQQHPGYWRQISKRAGGRWQKPTIGSDYQPEFLTMHSTCEFGDRGEPHAYQSFTSATGGSIYRGDCYPVEVRGDYFVCDPTGHLVRRAKLTRDAGKILVSNAYESQKTEFLVSNDINFRPVSTHSGPDGCLYVVDMYRGMIQDAPWVNEQMQAMLQRTGLNFNIHHGRIYRIVHDDFEPTAVPRLLDMSIQELVTQLDSDNGWVRDTAQKLIVLRMNPFDITGQVREQYRDRASLFYEHGDVVISALQRSVSANKRPLARLHALWTLDGIGATSVGLLVKAMSDADWRVREAAVRISEGINPFEYDAEIAKAFSHLSESEDDPNVARQLILSLGENLTPQAAQWIDRIIERHISNEVVYLSAMTALYKQSTPLIERMLTGKAFRTIRDSATRINTQRRWMSGIAGWEQESAPPRPLDDEAIKLIEDGYHIYAQLCINCHGKDGRGIPVAGLPAKAPALAGSPRVTGQKEVLARIVLHGLAGPVDGKTYHEVMAPSDKQNDEWIAAVTSYIRQDWGNLASVIRPDDIADVRAASKGRYRPWTQESLQRFSLPQLDDRDSWRVDSNAGPESAARAINGKSDSCDNQNQPGRWYEIDLGTPHTVTSMVLTSATPDRYPRGVEIRVSDDKERWSEPITRGKGEGAINVFSMEPTLGRYFRIVQTGSDDHHRWSISDLQIHGVKGKQVIEAIEDEGPLPPTEELLKLTGNAASGEVVFKRTCIQCHKVDGAGTDFGPDLSHIAKERTPAELLQSILQPGAIIDKAYQGEMVITADGRILSGFVIAENEDGITIRIANNQVDQVAAEDVEERQLLKTSFMPTGLERTMKQQELVDLLMYLQERK